MMPCLACRLSGPFMNENYSHARKYHILMSMMLPTGVDLKQYHLALHSS